MPSAVAILRWLSAVITAGTALICIAVANVSDETRIIGIGRRRRPSISSSHRSGRRLFAGQHDARDLRIRLGIDCHQAGQQHIRAITRAQ